MSTIRIPAKIIFDTSIYIPFINKGISYPTGVPPIDRGKQMIFMSAVVIEELYAGAFDTQSIKLLDKLYLTFEGLDRLIIPDAVDWQKTGKIIAKIGRKYGYESIFLKITNDVLISVSARRIGAMVVTNNIKDFLKIKEFVDFKLYHE
ncbi:MAG: PIN domain-containing protein [Candidatus Brocadiaceae bacterium]